MIMVIIWLLMIFMAMVLVIVGYYGYYMINGSSNSNIDD